MRNKKILALFPFLLLMLIFVPLGTVNASEPIEYNSNGAASFYGEYVFPEEGDNGGTSTQPGENGNGGVIGVLPTTGDEQSALMIISGLILLGVSSVYLFKRRRNIQ